MIIDNWKIYPLFVCGRDSYDKDESFEKLNEAKKRFIQKKQGRFESQLTMTEALKTISELTGIGIGTAKRFLPSLSFVYSGNKMLFDEFEVQNLARQLYVGKCSVKPTTKSGWYNLGGRIIEHVPGYMYKQEAIRNLNKANVSITQFDLNGVIFDLASTRSNPKRYHTEDLEYAISFLQKEKRYNRNDFRCNDYHTRDAIVILATINPNLRSVRNSLEVLRTTPSIKLGVANTYALDDLIISAINFENPFVESPENHWRTYLRHKAHVTFAEFERSLLILERYAKEFN